MTYAELLEAIDLAQERKRLREEAASHPARWNGTSEQKDAAEQNFQTAEAALNEPIPNWSPCS